MHLLSHSRYILSEQLSQFLVEKLLWKAVGKRRQGMRTQLQNSALAMLPLPETTRVSDLWYNI